MWIRFCDRCCHPRNKLSFRSSLVKGYSKFVGPVIVSITQTHELMTIEASKISRSIGWMLLKPNQFNADTMYKMILIPIYVSYLLSILCLKFGMSSLLVRKLRCGLIFVCQDYLSFVVSPVKWWLITFLSINKVLKSI